MPVPLFVPLLADEPLVMDVDVDAYGVVTTVVLPTPVLGLLLPGGPDVMTDVATLGDLDSLGEISLVLLIGM